MGTRTDLDRELRALLGSNNCYFQPPETTKLAYDCIIYRLANAQNLRADDVSYKYTRRYTLTLVTKNPDNALIDLIPQYFKYCNLSSFYTSDNLNHYNYELYY